MSGSRVGFGGRRAFTLVEVLVVIGVIAVLVALLLPALRGARGAALQTVSLANVRSVGQVMAVYAGEHDRHPFRGLGEYPSRLTEVFPGFTPQEGVAMYLWYPRGVLIGTSGHFEQAWLWPSIVLDLEDWPEHWETWVSPSKDRPLPTHEDFEFSENNPVADQISVRYSNAFVARPEFFGERRGSDPAAWDRLLQAPPDQARCGSRRPR
jgi:prepilin-type N-terminal cleavage/methylation domain-containing protein